MHVWARFVLKRRHAQRSTQRRSPAPIPEQQQPAPGDTKKLEPVPDHGEQSYQGTSG